MTQTVYHYTFYRASSDTTGKTGLTVTYDGYKKNKSTGAASTVVIGGSATEIGSGLYGYDIAGADPATFDYVGVFKTADTSVAEKHLPAIRWDGAEAHNVELANLDAAISTRSTVAAIWDEVLTGATHNIAGSAGKRLRQLASNIVYSGTVVSATTNTLRLDTGADASDGAYDPALLVIVSGTGTGQSRLVYQYTGATRTCVVDRDWKIQPTAGDEYMILADAGREHVNEGLLRAATSLSAQLNTYASSENDAYIGQVIFIRSGTGADQARRVFDYDGATQTVSLGKAWDITPDTTSAYVMLPTGVLDIMALVDRVWNETLSDHLTAGTTGKALSDAAIIQSVSQPANPLDGSDITALRGDTLTVLFAGLGDVSARSKLYFTAKSNRSNVDADALLQVEATGGLLVLNGAAATTTGASLTVTNQAVGDMTLVVNGASMSALAALEGGYYDVQMVTTTSAVDTLTYGTFTITEDVTRAVS